MERRYLHESFRSNQSEFDQRFSDYLNDKSSDRWKVKDCTYSTEGDEKIAACLFKGKHHDRHHHHHH